jgi:hypothetical protein
MIFLFFILEKTRKKIAAPPKKNACERKGRGGGRVTREGENSKPRPVRGPGDLPFKEFPSTS